ncbi:MAG: hypothetical protein F7B59_03940 [Desulfurococcales archaeon]|nr:hypothetical protein [Desulfurococcales archaeon]
MKMEEKILKIVSDPKTASILVFAVVVAAKSTMILGGGHATLGDVVG